MVHDKIDEIKLGVVGTTGGTGILLSTDQLQHIIAIVTLIVVIAQGVLLVPKYWAIFKGWKQKRHNAKWAKWRAIQKHNRKHPPNE